MDFCEYAMLNFNKKMPRRRFISDAAAFSLILYSAPGAVFFEPVGVL